MAKLSDDELMAMLSSERADAIATMDTAELPADREKAMDYYLGQMDDMPSQEGQSKAVSTDVADTVLGMMPFLVDCFCSSDDVVRLNAVGPDDEEAAQQESDYLNHVFMNQNNGYVVMNEFMFDALLQKLGAVKVWWDEHDEEEKETYLGLSEDQFAQVTYDVIQPDSGLEIIEHDEEQKTAPDPMTGQPVPTTVHNVKILRTRNVAQAKVLSCAPEEIGWNRNTRTMRECTYFFHSPPNRTEADLIAEGYDEEQIKALPSYNYASNSEQLARDTIGEENFASASANRSGRPIQITEHYIRMDYEGNGKPCLYKITTGGEKNQVLKKDGKSDIEEADVIPFAVLTPILQPHRLVGRSLADLVMDIQRINTALLRGTLDNSYMVSNPRHEVAESGSGVNTLDDLLTVRRNGVVRVKTSGTIVPLNVQPIVGDLLPVMTYMDQIREMRSGVTRTGQGVDANALQNQSATAVNQVFTQAQAKMKMIARTFAETGIKDMFWLLHATIRKHGQKAETVKLRNNWVNVDPREWKTRNDMTVQVGLGDGGKAQQFAQIQAIAAAQEKLLMGGKAHLVDDAKLFNTAAEGARIMGHKSPDRFFNDPNAKNQDGSPKYPPVPPPPDPKVQVEMMKAQLQDKQLDKKAQLEAVQAQADIATQDRKTQAEMTQTERDFDLKAKLAVMQAQLDAELKAKEEARKEREFEQKMAFEREKHQMQIRQAEYGMATSAQQHEQTMQTKQVEHKNAETKTASVDQIKELKQTIEDAASAPVEIIRDKSGRAAQIKRGNRTMTVQRGKDGKPEKLG